MRTIEELQVEMYDIAEQLNVPLPKYEELVIIPIEEPKPNHGVWYELGEGGYIEHQTEERSYEYSFRFVGGEEELLFMLTKSLVWHMASNWALARLNMKIDSRRFIFAREIELLGLVNPQWQKMRQEEIRATLERAPYRETGPMPPVDAEYEKKNKLYLETNRKKDGVRVTEYGAHLEILSRGTGAKPRRNSTITFHLLGTDIEGVEFDNTRKRGQAYENRLESMAFCVREEIQKMGVGAKYRFVLPAELDTGSTDRYAVEIKPGSVLIYEIELMKIA